MTAPAVALPVPVDDGTVRAAGALLWRGRGKRLEVAIVHRPKYDDWSWPKGKLDPGESWAEAAVREVLEETGLHARLGIPLPLARYRVGAPRPHRPKVVQYWAAQVIATGGPIAQEVDEVRWLPAAKARRTLRYRRDQMQLDALLAAADGGALDSWPLLVIRHASTVPRSRWKGEDDVRPLNEPGKERAAELVPVLAAYHVQRLVTSDTERCAATLAPYARSAGLRLRGKHSLSEEGFAKDGSRLSKALDKLLAHGEPAALCTHRPVLPTVLRELAERTDSADVAEALRESAGPGLVKGEVLVAHVRGRGDDARVVAVERHDTY
ncbi:NUDIX hydrolase [Angustibacter sp. McL0619]|uniref:NUDIX hydrolase n=1 Tax=Angustibacter sp. McL0619 TaxID=3415676 RepID=UPI003CF235AD